MRLRRAATPAADEAGGAVELIHVSAEATGAAAGAAIGIVAGPPGVIAGAAGGALVAYVARKVGNDLHARTLSPLQRRRVSRAFALALSEIQARVIAGEEIRQDRFFEAEGERRSTAEELLEGILLRLADDYEERKLEYVQRIYAGLVFDSSVAPEYGYFLVKTASELTYRQLLFLAHFGGEDPPLPDFPPESDMLAHVRAEGSAIGAELMDLGSRGLLVVRASGQAASLTATLDAQAIVHFRTNLIGPSAVAKDLHRLMRLETVERAEIDELFAQLTGT